MCLIAAPIGNGHAQTATSFGTPNPALFVAEDEDTTIYIFGTIHVVPCVPDTDPPICATGLAPTIRDAIGASDEVWLEIADVTDFLADPSFIMDAGFFSDGSRLSDHIPRNEMELIAEMIIQQFGGGASIEAVVANIDPMMPWMVTLMLGLPDTSPGGGWALTGGVDVEVANLADLLGTPVFGFETAEEQAGLFASDPVAYQVADLRSYAVLLKHGVDLATLNQASFTELWDIWSAGLLEEFEILFSDDTDVLAEIEDAEIAATLGLTDAEYALVVEEIEAFYPAAMQEERLADSNRLITDRNLNWMSDIESMLDRPGTFFIAVGAGHLVGEFGLPVLLAEAGVTVERVQ